MKPLKYSTVSATLGLLAFAATLQIIARLAMALFQYQAPCVSETAKTLHVVRGLTIAVLFFIIVALLVFGTAPLKTDFCHAFDPDAEFNGLPCGYGNGFNIAIAAAVFGAVQVALAWSFMTLDLPAMYAFSAGGAAGGAGSGKGAFESSGSAGMGFNSAGFGDASAAPPAFTGSAASGASAYQTI